MSLFFQLPWITTLMQYPREVRMIRNQWYAVLASNEVKKKIVAVKRLNEKLIFYRDSSGKVVCMLDKCAHRFVALSAGKLVEDRIQCPFHGLEYDTQGRCVLIPANGRNASVPERFWVRTYPCFERHGLIWIFWGDRIDDIGEPQYFDDMDEGMKSCLKKDYWTTHYSRAIENQLDVAHVPFVHRNTIGRGNRTLVDGPVFKWKSGGKYYLFVYNRLDDGTQAKKPEEITPDEAKDFRLEFIFPNIWQNHISEKFRITIAFVPVDDENTILYIRSHQSIVIIPGLSSLFLRLSMVFNRIVAHQDRRVVITQEPKRSDLKGGEELFQADRPIVEYRRIRQGLIEGKESYT
jgi:phenylpropionate dioxygenase-like ring-hydroxylating dioxygenase large terminal subunit